MALGLLVALPLIFDPFAGTDRDAFTGIKTALLEIGAAFLALAWIFSARGRFLGLPATVEARNDIAPPWHRSSMRAVQAYALVLCLATLFSVNPKASLRGTIEAGGGLLSLLSALVVFLALGRVVRSANGVARVTRALVAPSIAVSLLALAQAAGFDALQWVSDSPSPAIATLGRSNVVGAYLAAMAPLTLGAILDGQAQAAPGARLDRLGAALLLQVAGILVSLSRAGWLAFAGGALVCLGVVASRRRKAWPLLAVGALVATAAALLYPAVERGWSLRQGEGFSFLDKRAGSVRTRLVIWEETLGRVGDRWLLGYGPATFETVFARQYPDRLLEFGPQARVDDPHNLLLSHLTDTGVLGLLAFAAVVGNILLRGLSPGRTCAEGLPAAPLAGPLGSAAAFLIAAQFNRGEIVTWVVFWAVLALIAWHSCSARTDQPEGENGREEASGCTVQRKVLLRGQADVRR